MKKILVLATAAFLVSGVSFAQDKKSCCKKGSAACKDKEEKSTVKSKAAATKSKTVKI